MADITILHAQDRSVVTSEGVPERAEYTMPLGCLYLMASLQQHGYSVDFRDYQFNDFLFPQDPENLVRFLDGSAEIVGVSCLVDFLPLAVLAMRRLKQRHPEKTVILGGPGPAEVAELLMAEFPFIDIVAIGEGEATIVELVDRLSGGRPRSLDDVKGIVFRRDGAIRCTARRARVKHLDEIPFPHPSGVDLTRYTQAHLITSRGCPYKCTFCDVSPLWDRKTTYRSIDNFIGELMNLARMGFTEVAIQDDNFFLDRKRVMAFSTELSNTPGAPGWSCLGRVDLVNENLLTHMTEAGCRGIFFGVESGSDRVLKAIMKDTTAEVASRAVTMALKHVAVKAYFIWGFPQESVEDLTKTLLLMSYLNSMGAMTPITLLAPLPQSILYYRYKNQLVLDRRMFAHNFVAGFLLRRDDNEEVFELVRRYPQIFPSFYTYKTAEVDEKIRLTKRVKEALDMTLTDWQAA